MESSRRRQGDPPADASGRLELRLLGPLAIRRGAQTLALPPSRKVRALLGYLALAPRAVPRSRLCELFWDVPDDPRGELRWCLSKLRGLVDEPGRRRVLAQGGAVRLDLSDCGVDALEVARAAEAGFPTLDLERQRALCALFEGDLLEGSELAESPAFEAWLTAQRRRFQGCHAALLEQLAARLRGDEALAHAERWTLLAPFDRRAHACLLSALAQRGRLREGEAHLAATARRFESEGLDPTPLQDSWNAAREQAAEPRDGGAVSAAGPPPAAKTRAPDEPGRTPARRASLAVMPFVEASGAAVAGGGAADALAHDVITRLAQLRSLFVIAQGSVFALHERGIGPEQAGRMLDVDYVVGGSLRRRGERLSVTAELVETRSARIVWADSFDRKAADAFAVLDEIGNRIVASVASEIEAAERNRAILRPPSSLDAWEAHHRGLWHAYRFTREDNEQARHFLAMAVRLDPTFARAHAGLSFTHFQSAFQGWGDREAESVRAYETAAESLLADERDPAAHYAMGRALWLRGGHDPSVPELELAVGQSPNFALGHYALAFVRSQAGDAHAAIAAVDHARELSPFDPLLFAMLGTRAIALVRLERFEEAAAWAARAAARPNAHPHIHAIAAMSLALAGSLDDARAQVAAIRRRLPGYGLADFLAAFRFDPHGAATFRAGAARLGMG
jgi:DNA-binding SARP family transcriptional activator